MKEQLLLPRMLWLLIPAFAAALRLNVTRHASSCELSHPHGVWEWAADVQIGTPPKTKSIYCWVKSVTNLPQK